MNVIDDWAPVPGQGELALAPSHAPGTVAVGDVCNVLSLWLMCEAGRRGDVSERTWFRRRARFRTLVGCDPEDWSPPGVVVADADELASWFDLLLGAA